MQPDTMLYICDPYKNTGCQKENCYALCGGPCYKTTNRLCTMVHSDGSPIESGTIAHWQARHYATMKQRTYNDKEVIA